MRNFSEASVKLLLLFLTGWAQSAAGFFDFNSPALYQSPTLYDYELEKAIKAGNLAEVKRFAACECTDFLREGIKLDLDLEMSVFMNFGETGTLLHLAVKSQSLQVVEVVLSAGINPNSRSTSGLQAIHYAAKEPSPQIVQLLLNNGADPNTATKDDVGAAPLHLAAEIDNTAVIEVLLNADADIEQLSLADRTPLGSALAHGRMSAARLLLEAGANSDPKLHNGGSLKDIICPCRAEYSCKQFTCSKKDVRALKNLLSKFSLATTPSTSNQSDKDEPSKPAEKEPPEDSGAPSPLDRLAALLEFESGK